MTHLFHPPFLFPFFVWQHFLSGSIPPLLMTLQAMREKEDEAHRQIRDMQMEAMLKKSQIEQECSLMQEKCKLMDKERQDLQDEKRYLEKDIEHIRKQKLELVELAKKVGNSHIFLFLLVLSGIWGLLCGAGVSWF